MVQPVLLDYTNGVRFDVKSLTSLWKLTIKTACRWPALFHESSVKETKYRHFLFFEGKKWLCITACIFCFLTVDTYVCLYWFSVILVNKIIWHICRKSQLVHLFETFVIIIVFNFFFCEIWCKCILWKVVVHKVTISIFISFFFWEWIRKIYF